MKWLLIFVALSALSGCIKPSEICEKTGGKWGSVKSECIRPNCAKNNTCGRWASPNQWCEKVKIGDDKDKVRFWLGEPDNETDNTMIWIAYKAQSDKIHAKFDNNALTKLECPQ